MKYVYLIGMALVTWLIVVVVIMIVWAVSNALYGGDQVFLGRVFRVIAWFLIVSFGLKLLSAILGTLGMIGDRKKEP